MPITPYIRRCHFLYESTGKPSSLSCVVVCEPRSEYPSARGGYSVHSIRSGLKTAMAVLFISLFFMIGGCRQPDPPPAIDVTQALAAPDALPCFKRATVPKTIRFPDDMGPHDDYQTEWWYYTGNLSTPEGRRFGYQLTFFRRALACERPQGTSRWRTRQLYFAHFALTDVRADTFYQETRMNRRSLGIAGARSAPYAVWIDNWRADGDFTQETLTAQGKDFAVNLTLERDKPPVLQGINGLSRKSRAPGNASYYYSFTRNRTRGTLTTQAGTFEVSGLSWFDHEWSTSALAADETGWDWFALHLSDGRDIMVCRIRKADGRPNGFSFGCLSRADGRYDILSASDFELTVTRQWTSPTTNRTYPSGWTLSLPGPSLEMTLTPLMPHQEHTGDFVYWEGAVSVSGTSAAGPSVSGSGYVEMTGYTAD